MGNHLPASAANASLSLLSEYIFPEKITPIIETWMREALAALHTHLEQVKSTMPCGHRRLVELKKCRQFLT